MAKSPIGKGGARVADLQAFPTPGHNHRSCLETALERARLAFDAKGVRLTELRRQVFEEIAGSHHAVGAYEVLDRLAKKGQRLAPISVYRVIDALLGAGVIHRLESRNAFFACHAGHEAERDQLILACETCGRVAEIENDAVFRAMQQTVRRASFAARRMVVEVSGRCADCRASQSIARASHDE